MSNMEEDLIKYRKKKKMSSIYQQIKQSATGWFRSGEKKQAAGDDIATTSQIPQPEPPKASIKLNTTTNEPNNIPEQFVAPLDDPTSKIFKYSLWILSSLLWAVCYAIAIELEFGIVFLIVSALVGLYYSTNTRPKSKDEPSAYSVFNPNFETINGTLTAEMFEQAIGAKYMKT